MLDMKRKMGQARERQAGREAAAGGQLERRVAQYDSEEARQQQAQPEDRHRHPQVSHHHRPGIERAFMLIGRDNAERHAYNYREQHRAYRKLQGHRQTLKQDVTHRAAKLDGVAQVGSRQAGGIAPELHQDVVVQPKTHAKVGTCGCRGPLAKHGDARVARNRAHEYERYEYDT
jgi:hypothetical protein